MEIWSTALNDGQAAADQSYKSMSGTQQYKVVVQNYFRKQMNKTAWYFNAFQNMNKTENRVGKKENITLQSNIISETLIFLKKDFRQQINQ